jgi:hypothetical protein
LGRYSCTATPQLLCVGRRIVVLVTSLLFLFSCLFVFVLMFSTLSHECRSFHAGIAQSAVVARTQWLHQATSQN